jgi:hypothetical protein
MTTMVQRLAQEMRDKRPSPMLVGKTVVVVLAVGAGKAIASPAKLFVWLRKLKGRDDVSVSEGFLALLAKPLLWGFGVLVAASVIVMLATGGNVLMLAIVVGIWLLGAFVVEVIDLYYRVTDPEQYDNGA